MGVLVITGGMMFWKAHPIDVVPGELVRIGFDHSAAPGKPIEHGIFTGEEACDFTKFLNAIYSETD